MTDNSIESLRKTLTELQKQIATLLNIRVENFIKKINRLDKLGKLPDNDLIHEWKKLRKEYLDLKRISLKELKVPIQISKKCVQYETLSLYHERN